MRTPYLETTTQRRLLMSKIRGRNTKPEIRLRKALHAVGLRYRINDRKLPGTPDISIKKYRIAIFVDGEFWHGKDWELKKGRLKNNAAFWIAKIETNILRDKMVNQKLVALGFTVLRFWSLEVGKELGRCVREVVDAYNLKKYPHQQ